MLSETYQSNLPYLKDWKLLFIILRENTKFNVLINIKYMYMRRKTISKENLWSALFIKGEWIKTNMQKREQMEDERKKKKYLEEHSHCLYS